MSKFRGVRSIFLNYPLDKKFPELNFKINLSTKIGGVFGMGADKSETTIIMKKNEFFTG